MITAALAAVLVQPAAQARRPVPFSFFGVNWTGGVAPSLDTAPEQYQAAQVRLMARSGVGTLRAAFYWNQAQPYATAAQVPPSELGHYAAGPGGVPTSFERTDWIVQNAVRRGLRVMPVVMFAPAWASLEPTSEFAYTKPSTDQTFYDNYLRALIGRYGPKGSFWASHPHLPRRPIRQWQIWNEPNLGNYWQEQPYEDYYVPMLRAAYATVHAADPGAKVILAGLPNQSWIALNRLYKAGAKGYYDIASLHPFTHNVSGVFKLINLFHDVMRHNGDARKPLVISEVAWSTARGHIPADMLAGIEVSRRQQRANLASAFKRLARARRKLDITGVYWEGWSSVYSQGFTWDYAGLVHSYYAKPYFRPMPLLRVYSSVTRRLEGR